MISNTKTISNEKELNKIFGIETYKENIKEDTLDNKDNNTLDNSESLNDYEVREILFSEFIDIGTWNKIRQFERENPDKIRKWREEDEERYRDDSILVNGIKETCEEKVIKICLSKYPRSKFVHSVSEYYKRYGKISEKQFNILKSMIGK